MVNARKIRGFTLIELMIIIALLAIVISIAVPNFTQFIRNNNVQAKADELNSFLHYARAQAIATRKPYEVVFTSINTEISLNQKGKGTDRKMEVNTAKAIVRGSGSATSIVEYLPSGAVSAEGALSVCYDNDAANGYVIEIRSSGLTQRHPRGRQADGSALTNCTL